MSRFYASIEGQAKTQATRRGGKESGIRGHIRSWGLGIEVIGRDDNGIDIFEVWVTSGSNGSKSPKFVKSFTKDDLN